MATTKQNEKVDNKKVERQRPKAVLKDTAKEKDCYTPGCHNIKVEPCEGIPMSNKCASCKAKKIFMGIED